MDDSLATKLLAGIDRIEQRQTAYEVVVHRILTCIEIHNEKLDLLLREQNTLREAIEDLSAGLMENPEPLPDWVTDPSVPRPEPTP